MKERIDVPVQFIQDIVDQLVMCNYTCEAGHIEHNVEFQKLSALVSSVMSREPLWEIAPDWAQWFAIDKSGDSYWYADEPYHTGGASWHSAGEMEEVYSLGEQFEQWEDSKKQRPETVAKLLPYIVDWHSAPSWAKWFAVDYNGHGYWYEDKPELHPPHDRWFMAGGSLNLLKVPGEFSSVDWDKSLTERPTTTLLADETPSGSSEAAPDWSEAPSWTRYWAQDLDGATWWYEKEPKLESDMWFPESFEDKKERIGSGTRNPKWKETLQERPV